MLDISTKWEILYTLSLTESVLYLKEFRVIILMYNMNLNSADIEQSL